MFLIFWGTDVRIQIWMLSVLPKSIKKKKNLHLRESHN